MNQSIRNQPYQPVIITITITNNQPVLNLIIKIRIFLTFHADFIRKKGANFNIE